MCGWTWEMAYGRKNGFSATLQTLATFRSRQSSSRLLSVVSTSSRMKWTPLEGSTPASVDGGDHTVTRMARMGNCNGTSKTHRTPSAFHWAMFQAGQESVSQLTQATALSGDVWEENMLANRPNAIWTRPLPQGHAQVKKHLSEHIVSYF